MEFDAGWQNALNKKDHSPAADINAAFLASEIGAGPIGAKVSNSTDDFEHITNEKIDFDLDTLGNKAASVMSSIARETPSPPPFFPDDDSDNDQEVLMKPTKVAEPTLPIHKVGAFEQFSDPWDQPASLPVEPELLPTYPKSISPEPIRPVSISPERESSLHKEFQPIPVEPEILLPTKVSEVVPAPVEAPPKAPEPVVQRTITPEPVVTQPKAVEPVVVAAVKEPEIIAPTVRTAEPAVSSPKPVPVAVSETAKSQTLPNPSSTVSSKGKQEQMIAVEEIFYKLGLGEYLNAVLFDFLSILFAFCTGIFYLIYLVVYFLAEFRKKLNFCQTHFHFQNIRFNYHN